MQQLKRVVFVSQADAEAMEPDQGFALISITDPSRADTTLRHGWPAIHRARFDDYDPVDYPDEDSSMQALTDDQALAMGKFVIESADRYHTLIVHCRYGVSRSAGVARAIAHEFGLEFPKTYNEANEFVCRALRWAIGELRR